MHVPVFAFLERPRPRPRERLLTLARCINTTGRAPSPAFYRKALSVELLLRGIRAALQVHVPVFYKGVNVGECSADIVAHPEDPIPSNNDLNAAVANQEGTATVAQPVVVHVTASDRADLRVAASHARGIEAFYYGGDSAAGTGAGGTDAAASRPSVRPYAVNFAPLAGAQPEVLTLYCPRHRREH